MVSYRWLCAHFFVSLSYLNVVPSPSVKTGLDLITKNPACSGSSIYELYIYVRL